MQGRLRALGVEAGTSRIGLSQQSRYSNGENRFAGYQASVAIRLVIADLERVEQIVCELVDAAVNEIHDVSFETRELKRLRAEVRREVWPRRVRRRKTTVSLPA